MDQSKFKLSIAFLERIFGHSLDKDGDIDRIVYQAYWSALCGITDAKWETITKELVRTFIPSSQCPFPTIAHFVKAHADCAAPLEYHQPFKVTNYDRDGIASQEEIREILNETLRQMGRIE